MKRFIAVASIALVTMFAGVSVAQAAGKTISGRVIDPRCKPTDTVCMAAGALAGHPLAVRGRDGKFYLIVGPFAANKNAKLVAYVGKNVQVTGNLASVGGGLRLTLLSIK